MKEIKQKDFINLPYSLHDSKINHIKIIFNEFDILSDKIIIYFNEGFYKPLKNDCLNINGHIEFENVDLDYYYVHIINSSGNLGIFSGEKFTLQNFAEKSLCINFEIIDETYGYNKCKLSGYIYEEDETKECIIEIYYFGSMKYIVDE